MSELRESQRFQDEQRDKERKWQTDQSELSHKRQLEQDERNNKRQDERDERQNKWMSEQNKLNHDAQAEQNRLNRRWQLILALVVAGLGALGWLVGYFSARDKSERPNIIINMPDGKVIKEKD